MNKHRKLHRYLSSTLARDLVHAAIEYLVDRQAKIEMIG